MMRIITLSIFIFVFAHGLHSQTSSSEINFKFRALALNYPLNRGVYLQPEGGELYRIFSNASTDWIEYRGPNPIQFYSATPKAPGGRTVIGSFDATKAPPDPLLLFSKSDANSTSYRIDAINNSLDSAGPGSYRIFNFTEKTIAGRIDDQKFLLNPRASAFAQVKEQKDFEVTVQLLESVDSKPKRLYASSWTFSENFRYLVFILPSDDRTRGNIQIRLIPDLIR